jgi:DNA polymerase
MMDIVTIDFETFYSKDYSLSKITTEQYIRDPQFEVIGVAVKVNDGETEWFSGTMQETKKFLQKFDWANSIAVAHNAMFDIAILNWHFDLRPKKIVDTLSMARAIHGTEVSGSLDALVTHYGLGAKGTEVINALGKRRIDFTADELARYAGYCINDVELTYKLFGALASGFPIVELNLIDLTIRMFSEPVLQLDVGVLSEHLLQVQEKKSKLMSNIEADKDQLMSNPQLAELLRNYGVEPPMKVSPTTGKQTYAFSKTDEAFKALLEHESPIVQALVAARLGVKSTLEETRTQRFIDIAARGALPIPLKYYAAHTGRWGGCLVADTMVTVYNSVNGVEHKRIVDVLLDDLVWDGEAFVPHDGVAFSGYQEVITWDGLTGTPEHVVFTDAGEISLRDAMQGAHRITPARSPTQDDVDAARTTARFHKTESAL